MERLEALAFVIRETRRNKNLSQEQLAERAKLHRNFVSFIERSKSRPAIDSIFAIADALGVRASTLIARAEEIATVFDADQE